MEGATLVAPERIDAALAPYVGADRTIDDLQRARAALESIYARRGYGATQVLLPEQEIKDGVVRLRVVEVKLGRIRIEGNRFFDDDNVRLLAFYDYGRAWIINPQPFEQRVTGISSAGPGLRVAYRSNVSLRFLYGFIIQPGTPANQSSGRANFRLVWVF